MWRGAEEKGRWLEANSTQLPALNCPLLAAPHFRFDSDYEAVMMVNCKEYGLAAYFYTPPCISPAHLLPTCCPTLQV